MKTIYTLVFFLSGLCAFSQKVDLDRFNFTATFRTLPMARLDSNYRTYNVTVESSKLMRTYMKDLTPESSVIIEGWRRLEKEGHVNIKVMFEDLLPISVATTERVEAIKDKNGKQTGTRTYYAQEMTYTFSAFAEVTDYRGMHLSRIQLSSRGNFQKYTSPEFAVKAIADGYFVLNSLSITSRLFNGNVTRAINRLSDQLTDNYGYGEAHVRDYMWILDSKKHPEYDAHRKVFLELKDILFSMDANTPIDGMREKLKPVIAYFDKIKKDYSSNSKADRKLRYASYFNLAVIYYYLDDPQAMAKEASGLILNDYDTRDGKNLEESAIRLKNLFTESQYKTRHFPINIESFRGPNEATVSSN